MNNPDKKAAYFETVDGAEARCLLCPQKCVIAEGRTGICRTRTCRSGELFLLNYGRCASLAIDPIEKKPLYHFHPGRAILSAGGLGCNFRCAFCQNWSISQGDAPVEYISPEQLADEAAARAPQNVGAAFTYNEPLVWFEYIRDCAPLLRERGLKVVLVSNGFINPAPFAELAPHIDAMNIDLKSSEDSFYKKHCGGRVAPVMDTIQAAAAAGVWVEVTQLLITGLNDSEDQVEATARWLASVSPDIPLHLSRYFPNHKMDLPPTPPRALVRAYEIASGHLNYVYLGNMGDSHFSRTVCPECRAAVIERDGYITNTSRINPDMTCDRCGAKIAGIA